jgi:hypothetical protein
MLSVMGHQPGMLEVWVTESCQPCLEVPLLSAEVLNTARAVRHSEFNTFNACVKSITETIE